MKKVVIPEKLVLLMLIINLPVGVVKLAITPNNKLKVLNVLNKNLVKLNVDLNVIQQIVNTNQQFQNQSVIGVPKVTNLKK